MKSIFLFVFAKEEGINEILNFIFAASLFNIYHQRDYVRYYEIYYVLWNFKLE